MEITDELVHKLAKLSKLRFEGSAVDEIKQDLTKIFALVEKLYELDTEDVEPLVYLNEDVNVLRKDVVDNSTSKEEVLRNAPSKDSDYFKVPKVLQKGE